MKKISPVLACSDKIDLIDMLSSRFNIVKPHISHKLGKRESNFDLLFNLDGSDDLLVPFCNSVGIPRYPKSQQIHMLVSSGINTPNSVFNFIYQSGNDIDVYFEACEKFNSDSIVVKCRNGARGIGQIKIPKNHLLELSYDAEYLTPTEFIDKYKSSIGGLSDMDTKNGNDLVKVNPVSYLMDSINSGDMIIQECVNMVSEWRLLWFAHGEPIMYERKKQGDSWQAGIGHRKPITTSVNVYNNSMKKMIELWVPFFESTGAPFLAVDVYKDEFNNVGILEFQMRSGLRSLVIGGGISEYLDKCEKSILKLYNGS